MTNLEIEVKFYLKDISDMRQKITHIGGVHEKSDNERNFRFEDSDRGLLKNEALLRLRITQDQNVLTYKEKVRDPETDCKTYNEFEVTVSDFDRMAAILERIGYKPVQCYEKRRETYRIDNVVMCLDTMPFGNFIEIEGDPSAIKKTAEKLGFEWKNRILTNYLALFERLKLEFELDFNDVTFDNFKNTPIDFEKCHHLFVQA